MHTWVNVHVVRASSHSLDPSKHECSFCPISVSPIIHRMVICCHLPCHHQVLLQHDAAAQAVPAAVPSSTTTTTTTSNKHITTNINSSTRAGPQVEVKPVAGNSGKADVRSHVDDSGEFQSMGR